MKIAMIGAGNVGGNLGVTLGKAGHEIIYGVRGSKDLADLLARTGGSATAMAPAAAAAAAELVVLAVPGGAAVGAVEALGDLSGTIVVDCTNPVGWDDGPTFAPPAGHASLGAAVQAAAPTAKVVKGFNTFGAELHADPRLAAGPVDVFLAGDDLEAVRTVAGLADGAGFRAVPSGPLRNAALLENLAILWIHLAIKEERGREAGFVLSSR
jgi:NADPH-dependent F420 reductase